MKTLSVYYEIADFSFGMSEILWPFFDFNVSDTQTECCVHPYAGHYHINIIDRQQPGVLW